MLNKFKYLLLLTLLFLPSQQAKASGYQLNEYSVTGLGRAFAGSGVVGDDFSAIAFNPAGMVLKGSGGQLGISVVEMHSDTNGTLNSPNGTPISWGEKGRLRLYKTLPHGFAQYKINDRATVGMGIYSPFGLASVYNSNWFGASHGIRTELEVVDIAASGAYKINNQWSVGMAVIYRYVHGNLINSFPGMPNSRNQMDLDGWEPAYNFGVMYEPVKDTRFGVAYRLNTAHTVKGHHRIKKTGTPMDASYDADTTMTLPNQLTLSAYHKVNDKFGVSGTARWTKWDVFDVFSMHSTRGGSYIPEHWNNVWTYSAGLDYYHDENWTFRVGYSYDPTPIKNAFLRTARIPDSDRHWATIGASYKKDKWTVDVGYSHLFMDSSQIYNRDEYTILNAKAKSLSNMYAVQLQYDF